MRWFWVDRFTEFVSGSHAKAIKNITVDEEVLDDYCPGEFIFPPTLIIEGMAQLGGIMVAEHFSFEKHVVLAKVNKAVFIRPAKNGDRLHYSASLDRVQDVGATVIGKSLCDGELQAEINLMFAFLEEGRFTDGPLFGSGQLLSMLIQMNFFQVLPDSKGNPIDIYPALLAAG